MSHIRPPHNLPRRSVLHLAGAAAAATCVPALLIGCSAPAAAPGGPGRSKLRLIGWATLPHRLSFKGTSVGGLSGLDYDPTGDVWYALSDDRSDVDPARFYTLRLPVGADALGMPTLL